MTPNPATRSIIQINEELCDGCGVCLPSCAEGALTIVNGKARLRQEQYCDGLGACLAECPRGALTIVERPAAEFTGPAPDAPPVETPSPARPAPAPHAGCPGAALRQFHRGPAATGPAGVRPQSELAHWPVKLALVSGRAPFLPGAHLVVAADCVPVAYAGFHSEILRGRVVVTGCPKFDDTAAAQARMEDILAQGRPASVTLVRMEVPCCQGLVRLTRRAIEAVGYAGPVSELVITTDGRALPGAAE